MQLQILKSTNYPSAVKFEKSVKRDRSAAMRFAIRMEQTLRRGCMVSRAYLRTPLRGKDSCHECSRIKETTNSAQWQNIFITPSPRCRSGGRRKGHARGRQVSTRKLRERARLQALSRRRALGRGL